MDNPCTAAVKRGYFNTKLIQAAYDAKAAKVLADYLARIEVLDKTWPPEQAKIFYLADALQKQMQHILDGEVEEDAGENYLLADALGLVESDGFTLSSVLADFPEPLATFIQESMDSVNWNSVAEYVFGMIDERTKVQKEEAEDRRKNVLPRFKKLLRVGYELTLVYRLHKPLEEERPCRVSKVDKEKVCLRYTTDHGDETDVELPWTMLERAAFLEDGFGVWNHHEGGARTLILRYRCNISTLALHYRAQL